MLALAPRAQVHVRNAVAVVLHVEADQQRRAVEVELALGGAQDAQLALHHEDVDGVARPERHRRPAVVDHVAAHGEPRGDHVVVALEHVPVRIEVGAVGVVAEVVVGPHCICIECQVGFSCFIAIASLVAQVDHHCRCRVDPHFNDPTDFP